MIDLLLQPTITVLVAIIGWYFVWREKRKNKEKNPTTLIEKHEEKTNKYKVRDPEIQSSFAEEVYPILSNVITQKNNYAKEKNSIVHCLDGFLYPLLYSKDRKQNNAFAWAIGEAFFYSISNRNNLLIANYSLYASATVTSLLNLLRICRKNNQMAIVFIATTQTPGELAYGSADLELEDNFTEVNEAYKTEFRKLVSQYKLEDKDILIERHNFVRDKSEEDFEGDLQMLENVLTRINKEDVPAKPSDELTEWIRLNHACFTDNVDAPEKLARIQWVKNSRINKDKFNSDTICTDVILYGTIDKVSLNKHSFKSIPPLYSNFKINWRFGLQSIDLGRVAEGRAIKLLYSNQLHNERFDFLGFNYERLNDFIKILQNGEGKNIANPLGLEKSKFLINEEPWKNYIKGSNRPQNP